MAVLQVFRLPIRSGRWIGLAARTSIELGGYVPAKEHQLLAERYRELLNRTRSLEAALDQGYRKLDELAKIRQIRPFQRTKTISARLITALNPTQLIIDVGRDDGIKEGQLVLAGNAVIGKITSTSSHTAKVDLLTSANIAIRTTVRPSNVSGLLRGNGRDGMVIRVKAPCATKVGETAFMQDGAVTDLPVGTVVASQQDQRDPLMWMIKVQQDFEISRIQNVWVVLSE